MKKVAFSFVAGLMVMLPFSYMSADEAAQVSIEEAVKKIKSQDLSLKITAVNPDVSNTSQRYQAAFSEDLQEIQKKQAKYEDLRKDLQVELNAYESAYNYWLVAENLKLSEANLENAKNDLKMVNAKFKQGLASKMDQLQAQVSLNNAEAQYEETLKNANLLKYSLNQDLGQTIGSDVMLNTPGFKELSKQSYDANTLYNNVKNDHPSLTVFEEMVKVYDNVKNDVEDISNSDIGVSVDDGKLELQKEELIKQINVAKEAGDLELVDTLTQELIKLQQQIAQIKDSKEDVDTARNELDDYYIEQYEEANVQLEQQQEILEILSYQYQEQFERLDKKLSLYNDNVLKMKDIYEKTKLVYEQGLITPSEVEQARLGMLNAELQLVQSQKEYMVLKEELRVFKEGYLPQGR